MINVILADGHHIVRDGICALLEKQKNFKVTCIKNNSNEITRLLENGYQADILLIDINMPLINGLEFIETIHNNFQLTKIIILSMDDEEQSVIKAFQAGVSGYLLKGIGTDELTFAINHVYQYDNYVSSELMLKFLKHSVSSAEPIIPDYIKGIDFSDREKEILRLVSLGFTNHEISEKLFISKRTIENHRQNLIDRTGSKNTISLIRYALLSGVIV